MDLFNMTIEQLEEELKKYNNFSQKELELFNKGKEFIDKAIENNYGTEHAKTALLIYGIIKMKKEECKMKKE